MRRSTRVLVGMAAALGLCLLAPYAFVLMIVSIVAFPFVILARSGHRRRRHQRVPGRPFASHFNSRRYGYTPPPRRTARRRTRRR